MYYFHRINTCLRPIQNSRGQATFISVFVVFFLVLLVGIAVDVAQILHRRSQIQNAVDAGSIAGIYRLAAGSSVEGSEQAAADIIAFNLQANGVSPSELASISTQITTDENNLATMTANVVLNVPTTMLQILPAFASAEVSAESKAIRRPVNISLVLDKSSSMSGSKFADLQEAAKTFVGTFQEGLDQMAIISFQHYGQVERPMSVINDIGSIQALIDGLSTGFGTNIPDGIIKGRQELEAEALSNPDAINVLLLFTDGSPSSTHVTFHANSVNPDPPGNRDPLFVNPSACGDYDYYFQYSNGGSDFMKANPVPPGIEPECSDISGNQVDTSCLINYDYYDSRCNLRDLPGGINPTLMRQEHYNLSIIESDYAKDQNFIVFTIGLGNPAPASSDPYQSIDEYSKTKTYFLRRIANDPLSSGDPQFPIPNNSDHPAGIFLQTPNSNELEDLFLIISKKIKALLVS